MEFTEESRIWHATVGASGRVRIPREIRNELKMEPGSQLVWMQTDNGILLRPINELIHSIQQEFSKIGPADDVWSEELILERREEASRE